MRSPPGYDCDWKPVSINIGKSIRKEKQESVDRRGESFRKEGKQWAIFLVFSMLPSANEQPHKQMLFIREAKMENPKDCTETLS
jgi:hypothetical protein